MLYKDPENKQSGEKKHRSRFMETLYNIIDQKLYPELLVWGPGGKHFIITDTRSFEQRVLPFVCNHANFASFVRQLNMYCFKKRRVGSNPNASSYSHPFFIEGNIELLQKIVRKNPRKSALLKKNLQQQDEAESQFMNDSNLYLANETHKKLFVSADNQSVSTEKVQLMQNIIDEVITKTNNEADEGIMYLIQNYLNDEEDIAYGSYNNIEEFKTQVIERNNREIIRNDPKNLVGYSNYNEASGYNNHELSSFVQIDVSMEDSLKHSYLFRAKDFLECQNLIAAMTTWRSRADGCVSPINTRSGLSFERDNFSENSPDSK